MSAYSIEAENLKDQLEELGYFCFKAETLKEVAFFEEIQEKIKNGVC
ncbi:hypothetical protein SAMN04487907_101245 [Zunongwangia mangrovi]|uniref:Uncharacterized protein n=1 Tax=Zunongwangia mangrovi TaxID=1334022 RepID=A0A1I1DGL6_9FLAO|nr:hypothetical protein [Zunongwangia mangrovi]SFB71900.1 hypothetical protein SAMN04487907_101245 [Zunongwangia mangrovi]